MLHKKHTVVLTCVFSGGSSYSHEEIERVIKVNTVAPIFCTKQFLPDMLARKKGHIVNIASSAGLVGVPKMTECVSVILT